MLEDCLRTAQRIECDKDRIEELQQLYQPLIQQELSGWRAENAARKSIPWKSATDDSLFKMLYLAMTDITKKWTDRQLFLDTLFPNHL